MRLDEGQYLISMYLPSHVYLDPVMTSHVYLDPVMTSHVYLDPVMTFSYVISLDDPETKVMLGLAHQNL